MCKWFFGGVLGAWNIFIGCQILDVGVVGLVYGWGFVRSDLLSVFCCQKPLFSFSCMQFLSFLRRQESSDFMFFTQGDLH